MPTLREHKSSALAKIIGMGDPGTGKTGSLIEVVNRMDELNLERIFIADYDNGLDILSTKVKPENAEKVLFETFRDDYDAKAGGAQVSGGALSMAWPNSMQAMAKWPGYDKDIMSLGPESLFVLDTITGAGDAAMNYARNILKIDDNWRSVGEGMRLEDKLIQMLVSLGCHVIIFSHIRFMGGGGQKVIEDKGGTSFKQEVDSFSEGVGYPSVLGKQLPTQVCRHFNTVIEYKLVGKNRKIRTVPEDRISLKVPFDMKEELSQEHGLFEILKHYTQG